MTAGDSTVALAACRRRRQRGAQRRRGVPAARTAAAGRPLSRRPPKRSPRPRLARARPSCTSKKAIAGGEGAEDLLGDAAILDLPTSNRRG